MKQLIFLLSLFFITNTFAGWVEDLGILERPVTPATKPNMGSLWVEKLTKDLMFTDSAGNQFNVLLGGGTGGAALNDLSDVDTFTASPTLGQALGFDGTQWKPMSVAGKDLVAGQGVTIVQDATTATISSSGKDLVALSPISISQDSTTATFSMVSADYLDFKTSPTFAHADGRLHWDAVNKTLAFDVDAINGVEGQINQELWLEVINNTGVQINDGQVVYINGASGDFPTVALASAANYAKTIGIATQNIPNGGQGKVTMFGSVGGIDTSVFTAGDSLFLSASTAGSLTNIRPVSNIVEVAKAVNSNVSGKITVHVFKPSDDQTLDPTGFLDPSLASASYDYTTRQITLSGTYEAVWKGSKVDSISGTWVSPAHTATNGVWFLYYDGANVIWSQTSWTFDKLMIASAYYDGTVNSFGMNEMHGVMDWRAHRTLHLTTGTFLLSGADMSDYTLNSTTPVNRRPLVSAATVLDEDVSTVINAITLESYNRFYLTGASAVGTFAFNATDIIPVTGARPNYNQFTGGAWQQTPLSSNAYAAVWLIAIPVTSDANSQKFRYLWVQPQSESTTLGTIQALSPSSVNLNGLSTNVAEIVFVGKVIVRYLGAPTNNWTVISVEKLVGTKISQSAVTGNFLTAISTDASFTGDGSTTSPLALSGTVTTSGYQYFGTDANDSFRVYQSAGALITEKKIGGVWTEISRLDNL